VLQLFVFTCQGGYSYLTQPGGHRLDPHTFPSLRNFDRLLDLALSLTELMVLRLTANSSKAKTSTSPVKLTGMGSARNALKYNDINNMSKVLDQISLCTFSTGQSMVREVLDDWLHFLGGRPNQVIFAVSPRIGPPQVYEDLREEGVIDRIILLEDEGRSVLQIEPEAICLVVSAVSTEWVLLVKLDTLPYRSGHATWLDDAMEQVKKHGLFGMTGGFLIEDLIPLQDGYSTTQKFSNNFSLFRRSDWLNIIEAGKGNGDRLDPPRNLQFQGDNIRYLSEYLIETHLETTGQRMLVKHDSRDWSVFHINVWGEALRRVRVSYVKRQGVKPFFNTGKPLRRSLRYEWQKYYGYPRPPFFKLMRIVLGRWRRTLFRLEN